MTNVKINFVFSSIYQILIMIIPIITAPYVSRVIGAEGIGIYSYTNSIASYFALFIILGLNNYGNRSIAMVRDDKDNVSIVFWEIYKMQFFLGLIIISIYCCYIFFIANHNYLLFFDIQVLVLLSSLFDINWFYFGIEQFKITVTRNIIIKVITTILIFALVKSKNDMCLYALIISGGLLLSNIVLWITLYRYIDFSVFHEVKWNSIKSHFKPNLILFIPVIAISMYTIIDKVMVGSISGMVQAGFYENSEKIVNMPIGIIGALGTVMLPRISNLIANGNKKICDYYFNVSMIFVMFIAFGLCFGIAGIASTFAPVFFGKEFEECSKLISYLAIIVPFISWANVIRTQYLIPNHKDKDYIISVFIGAIVNLLFNSCFIYKYGAFGAVLGTIFAEESVALYQTYVVRKYLPIATLFYNSIMFIIPGTVMFAILYLINGILENSILKLIVELIVGILTYFLITFICMLINKKSILYRFFKTKFKFRNM